MGFKVKGLGRGLYRGLYMYLSIFTSLSMGITEKKIETASLGFRGLGFRVKGDACLQAYQTAQLSLLFQTTWRVRGT